MDTKGNSAHIMGFGPKIRVLFVITQSEMGGAQRFVFETISHLNKSKYELTAAFGPDGDGELLKKLSEIGIQCHILKHLRREVSPIDDLKAVFEIKKLIQKLCPNVLFLNSSKAGFIGSLACRLSPVACRCIYRIGGWTFNDPWPKWKKNLWIFLEKLSGRWKDIIIVNNQRDFDQAQSLGIKPRLKLKLIHNGLDVYKLDYLPKEEARLRLFEKIAKYSGKVFQAETVIGTIANFYPSKDIPSLISAAEYFRNSESVIFIVIGDGSERPQLEKVIAEKGLGYKVFLVGSLYDARKYLYAFDIFILPSVKEGFPWAIIEAMAAKLPVIATNVGAAEEIIENGKNGFLVAPGKPDQVADKVKLLISDDRLKQELGIQAHQTILFKFSLEKMIREIEAVIT